MGDPHEDLMGLLVAHTDAWNSHDLDRLMDLFDEECAFLAAGGEEACGTTYSGKGAVRSAFAEIYENVPDALWLDGKHSVLDVHRGVSEWRMVGTVASGARLEINGCDVGVTGRESVLAQPLRRMDGVLRERRHHHGRARPRDPERTFLRRSTSCRPRPICRACGVPDTSA